jgi:hypothetical protein
MKTAACLSIFGMIDERDIPSLARAMRTIGWIYTSNLEEALSNGQTQFVGSSKSPELPDEVITCVRRLGLFAQWAIKPRNADPATQIFDAASLRWIKVIRAGDYLFGDLRPMPGASPEDAAIVKAWPCPDNIEAGAHDARLIVLRSAHDALRHAKDPHLRPGVADAYFYARGQRLWAPKVAHA